MEDFSFPAVTADQDHSPCHLPFPHFASSPIWFLSPPNTNQNNDIHRRSLSSATRVFRSAELPRGHHEAEGFESGYRSCEDEEKMDMLWEDFNEELCRMSSERGRGPRAATGGWKAAVGEVSIGQRAVSPKGQQNGSMVHRRKPSLIVMIKVLKKLFLIQKAGSSKRASLC